MCCTDDVSLRTHGCVERSWLSDRCAAMHCTATCAWIVAREGMTNEWKIQTDNAVFWAGHVSIARDPLRFDWLVVSVSATGNSWPSETAHQLRPTRRTAWLHQSFHVHTLVAHRVLILQDAKTKFTSTGFKFPNRHTRWYLWGRIICRQSLDLGTVICHVLAMFDGVKKNRKKNFSATAARRFSRSLHVRSFTFESPSEILATPQSINQSTNQS